VGATVGHEFENVEYIPLSLEAYKKKYTKYVRNLVKYKTWA